MRRKIDPIYQQLIQDPLWMAIDKDEAMAKEANYLGIELNDIPNDKLEAFRSGYLMALNEVRRMMYGIKREQSDEVSK